MSGYYVLNAAGEPERCEDLLTWARWFESAREACQIALTTFGGDAQHAPPPAPLGPSVMDDLAVAMELADRMVHRRGHDDRRAVVSTIFTALDMRLLARPSDGLLPLLFETRVFSGPMDGAMRRYATRAEALDGHASICAQLATVLQGSGASPP